MEPWREEGMRKPGRTIAEDRTTASQRKSDQALKRKEKAWREITQKSARLRALRLAKEAAEREASEGKAEPEEPAAEA